MYTYGVAESNKDLEQILELQKKNLKTILSAEEKRSQGFVTLKHDLSLLKEMNSPYPHIICKKEDQIVGYALVMLRDIEKRIPALGSMFYQINSLTYQGKSLEHARFFIMGQVCVAKEDRGKGVFAGLYREMQYCMRHDFEYIVTEVDSRNTRSVRAHEKVGFQTIHIYPEGEIEWHVILLETAPNNDERK
jgi:L-amino acid N-acyltransferase YncA